MSEPMTCPDCGAATGPWYPYCTKAGEMGAHGRPIGGSRGWPKATAPKAPLDPKVGQMSEDAKAFGPAAQPSELRAELRKRDAAIRWALGEAPLPDGRWFDEREFGFTSSKVPIYWWRSFLQLYSGVAAPDGNAEGAKALEIARAEGKAEGLEAAAREIDIAAEALWRFGGHTTSEQFKTMARGIRSLIPAAPGGGGK